MELAEAHNRLTKLMLRLERISDKDPEQEVQGLALPVIDAIINAARGLLRADDPIVPVLRDVISPEAIAEGDVELRAVDAVVVIEQLLASLPPLPIAAIPYDVPWRDEGPDFMRMQF